MANINQFKININAFISKQLLSFTQILKFCSVHMQNENEKDPTIEKYTTGKQTKNKDICAENR